MEILHLHEILKSDSKGELFYAFANTFESRNKDVENFLKTKAVQSVKLCTSSTYLVSDGKYLLGYFTLATKILSLKADNLNSAPRKIADRFVRLDEETKSFRLPAILIAQFGRNFARDSSSIGGAELMNIALGHIKTILSYTSGKTVFLECERKEKLIEFYRNAGFRTLENIVYSSGNKELVQMFMFV